MSETNARSTQAPAPAPAPHPDLLEAARYALEEAASLAGLCDEICDLSKPAVKRWMEKVRDRLAAALASTPPPEAVPAGTNYVANREIRPTEMKFANGRRVFLDSDGFLDTDFGEMAPPTAASTPPPEAAPAALDVLRYARSEVEGLIGLCDEVIELSKPDVKRWMEKLRSMIDAALAEPPARKEADHG